MELKKQRKKIIFFVDQFIMGGVEKVAMVLLPKLAQYYDVILLVQKKVTDSYFLNFFNEKHIQLISLNDDRPKSFWKKKWRSIVGKRLVKMRCIKILKSADLIVDYKSMFALNFIKSLQIPKIAFFHGSFPLFQDWECVRNVKCYDKLVCLSESFKKDFIKTYPELQNKIEFIYNPVDVPEVRKKSKNCFVKIKTPYFVAIQRLQEDKDVATIIEAFNLFCIKNKDTYLYIVGDGSDREKLTKFAQNNSRIILTGQIDDSYHIIKSAEALILSSTEKIGEGLPTVLIEAQALGTLAVSSDVKSGPAEILLNGKAGILFKTHNAKELSKVMDDIISGKIDKKPLILCATENLKRFDKEIIIPQIINLIEQTLKEK